MRTPMLTLLILMLVAGAAGAGSLEPSAPPGPTMKTLDQIPPTWSLVIPGASRFQNALNGVGVLDRETGLVWTQLASNTTTPVDWMTARANCLTFTAGLRAGWRLPTFEELSSLLDPTAGAAPFLPAGHPLIGNPAAGAFWSATTLDGGSSVASTVDFSQQFGFYGTFGKSTTHFYWCVRGGAGPNGGM